MEYEIVAQWSQPVSLIVTFSSFRWCSLFNADLALSVTMTGISTLLSVVLLPINLMFYANMAYSDNVVSMLDWTAVFMSLGIVIGGIGLGRVASHYFESHQFHLNANRVSE